MLVVIGGHTRNIGKTSVVSGIIRGIPEARWTAVKITQYGHGVCTHGGHDCHCGPDAAHPYSLDEEFEASRSDSGRFLAAGAERSFWLRTPVGGLEAAVPAIRKILHTAANVIVESNSVLEFFEPELYLAVLDFAQHDFKTSSARFLQRADALVIAGGRAAAPHWTDIPPEWWRGKTQFRVSPPQYCSGDLLAFVRKSL